MKTGIITLLFSFSIAVSIRAQGPTIEWQRCLGGSGADWVGVAQQTSDGGFIMAGHSDSHDGDVTGNQGSSDFWVVKLDEVGVLQWQTSIGGASTDRAYAVQQTSDGGYVVAGHRTIISNGNFDFYVVKLSSVGAVQWQQTLDRIGLDLGESIHQTSDGGYVVAGSLVLKLNGLGIVQWEQDIGGTAASIKQTWDGGFIVAGNRIFAGPPSDSDYLVVKLSSVGEVQWEEILGGSIGDWATDVQQTSDGGFIVAGYSASNDGDVTGNHGPPGYTDYWVVKLNSVGSILWQKCFGGSDQELATSVQQTSDGGFIVAGHSMSNDGDVTGHKGSFDYWIIKISAAGILQWQQSLGGSGTDFAYSVQQTSDGGLIVGGYSFSIDGDVTGNHGEGDFWLVKLSSVTSIEGWSVGEISISPNPTGGILNIQMPRPIIGSIFVVDVLGREVLNRTISGATMAIDLSDEPTGLYFVTVKNDHAAYTMKILLD